MTNQRKYDDLALEHTRAKQHRAQRRLNTFAREDYERVQTVAQRLHSMRPDDDKVRYALQQLSRRGQ